MYLLDRTDLSVAIRNTLIILVPILAFALTPQSPGDPCPPQSGLEQLMASQDPFDMIVHEVTVRGLALHETPSTGFDPREVDVCLHPDTKPEDAERILRELPTYVGSGDGLLGYYIQSRWTWTASDGATGTQGDPITLTWGFVPDGTWRGRRVRRCRSSRAPCIARGPCRSSSAPRNSTPLPRPRRL